MIYGTWGAGIKRAATEFDGWVASGMHRNVDDLEKTIPAYRGAGGKRAIVSRIMLTKETDLGELGELLTRHEAAGFDDAVVMFIPGATSPTNVRKLIS